MVGSHTGELEGAWGGLWGRAEVGRGVGAARATLGPKDGPWYDGRANVGSLAVANAVAVGTSKPLASITER